jgi:3-hydroxyacyl-CoA dehydrogenase
MTVSKLEAEFDVAMMDIYVRAKSEASYTASIFHRMLSEKRGLATAKQLINDSTVSQGYTALWERGRLDLTVEAVVIDNQKWHFLFDEVELQRAKKRLEEYGYFKK